VLVPNNNETVIWKRGQSEVLTAGLNRVTNDRRFSILHDENTSRRKAKGDVWVLLIRNVKPNDTGIYTCEVNVNPVIRSFHHLLVKSNATDSYRNSNSTDYLDDLLPPNEFNDSFFNNDELEETQLHSYEECCKFSNVSTSCLGFCTLQNILNGTSGTGESNDYQLKCHYKSSQIPF
jgi:Immunoglobulin domain